MNFTHALGRAIFGGFFLYNGMHHFQEADALAKYAGAKQVACPDLAVKLSGALLAFSGAALLLGIKPHVGAAGAIAFLAPTTLKMHDFWNQPDPGARQSEMAHFSKNVALSGAAVALMGLGGCHREARKEKSEESN